MMSRCKVYIARKLPPPLEEMLMTVCDVESNTEDVLEERLVYLQKIKGADALITDSRVVVNEEVFEAAGPQLKVVSNYAVGYNNIDVAAATRRGIAVTNTPGVVDNATADIAWALMLSIARRVVESDRMIRTKETWGWTPSFMQGQDISGKTLGIIGAGRIGSTMAKRARGFDMKILYFDCNKNRYLDEEMDAGLVDLETLLKDSDFISVHIPLTTDTRHMISKKQFEIMKPTAVLINTSRGAVVDEHALAHALRTKQIWGAGLDVYENEPVVTPELLELDNVVMTPHIGTATSGTRRDMAVIAAQNVLDIMDGKVTAGLVNPEALQKK